MNGLLTKKEWTSCVHSSPFFSHQKTILSPYMTGEYCPAAFFHCSIEVFQCQTLQEDHTPTGDTFLLFSSFVGLSRTPFPILSKMGCYVIEYCYKTTLDPCDRSQEKRKHSFMKRQLTNLCQRVTLYCFDTLKHNTSAFCKC